MVALTMTYPSKNKKDDSWFPEEEQPTPQQAAESWFPEEEHAPPQQASESNGFMDFLKNAGKYEAGLGLGIGQGLGDVGASILNFPEDIQKHFTGKELYHVPHPNLRGYYPEGNAGKIGSHIGEVVGNIGFPLPAFSKAQQALRGIEGLRGMLARTLGGAGHGAVIGAASAEGNRGEGAGLGALLGLGSGAIPEIFNAGRSALDWMKRPGEQSHEISGELNNIERNKLNESSNTNQGQMSAADRLNEIHRQNLADERQSKQNLYHLFPNIPESEANTRQVEAIIKAKDNLKNKFNQRYNAFNEESGVKPIANAFKPNELRHEINAVASPRQRMAKGLTEQQVELNIVNEHGEPYIVTIPPKNGTVQDYIEFMRELRDASHAAFAKSNKAERAQQLELLDLGRHLRRLQEDTQRRLDASLTPAERKTFARIQHDYGNIFAPLNSSNTLRNIYYNKESSPSLLSKMLLPRQQPLHYYLLTHEPEYRNSIISTRFRGKGHPLHAEDIATQANKIKDVGKTEQNVNEILSPEQKAAMQHHINIAMQRGKIEKAKSAITQSPISKTINATDYAKARGLDQRTTTALDTIDASKNRAEELTRQSKILKMDKKDLDRLATERDYIKRMAKLGLTVSGINDIGKVLTELLH